MTIVEGSVDIVVVGAGLAGSAAARLLAESGRKVIVLDRRDTVAGNMYDYVDENGFLVHKYGPHTFHTNSDRLMDFMRRFEAWTPYELHCGTYIDGKHIEMPFNFMSIDQMFDSDAALELKTKLISKYSRDTTIVDMLKSDDEMIRNYAEYLFEHDFKLYTAKQWGIDPNSVDPDVLKRVPIRMSYDSRYLGDKYEVMPKISFTHCIQTMLYHPNISVELNSDFRLADLTYCRNADIPVVFTGPLDRLFNYRCGRLPYRSLMFDKRYSANMQEYQPYAVEAYPEDPTTTRVVEYNKLTGDSRKPGTCFVIESACKADESHEPYYPVRSAASDAIYKEYSDLVKTDFPNMMVCGRLALFRYMNMDQTLQTAFDVIDDFLKK